MSGHRENGANGAHGPHAHGEPPRRALAPATRPLDVASALTGRRLLVTGATGFVGKVTLTLLLDRYPDVGAVLRPARPPQDVPQSVRTLPHVKSSLMQRSGGPFQSHELNGSPYVVGGAHFLDPLFPGP